ATLSSTAQDRYLPRRDHRRRADPPPNVRLWRGRLGHGARQSTARRGRTAASHASTRRSAALYPLHGLLVTGATKAHCEFWRTRRGGDSRGTLCSHLTAIWSRRVTI